MAKEGGPRQETHEVLIFQCSMQLAPYQSMFEVQFFLSFFFSIAITSSPFMGMQKILSDVHWTTD